MPVATDRPETRAANTWRVHLSVPARIQAAKCNRTRLIHGPCFLSYMIWLGAGRAAVKGLFVEFYVVGASSPASASSIL